MYWIAFGDVHEQTGMLGSIPDLAGAAGVIVTGDLTTRGGPDAARRVLEAIRTINPNIWAQIGNMDTDAVSQEISAQGRNLHRRILNLTEGTDQAKICMFGLGMSSFTPFGTPSEVSDDQLGLWLAELEPEIQAQRKDSAALVAVIHNPPVDTVLDLVGGNTHVGSPSVRAFLERVQPDICLTGHIHESVGREMVGSTLAINPGMLAHGGYVRLDLENGRLSARLERVGGAA